MLVVDLMHEFELGIWKYTFIHIIRVLYAAAKGGIAVNELNARWVKSISMSNYIKQCNKISENTNIWQRYYLAVFK
jgi:hypothetical protein